MSKITYTAAADIAPDSFIHIQQGQILSPLPTYLAPSPWSGVLVLAARPYSEDLVEIKTTEGFMYVPATATIQVTDGAV